MALRIIDGYDYAPAAGDYPVIAAAQGWTGNQYHYIGYSSDTCFGYGFSQHLTGNVNVLNAYRNARGRYDSTDVLTVGFRLKMINGTSTLYFGTFDTQAEIGGDPGVDQWTLGFDNYGAISLYTGPRTGTLVGKTTAYAFFPIEWAWIEIQWNPGSGTSGTMEVKVNTVTVLSFPACATAYGTLITPVNPGFDLFHYNTFGANNILWDDFYFLDDSGAQNTTYLGNARVKLQLPDGAGAHTQWNIGGSSPAATNWQSVLNSSLNDTKYVYEATVGDRDTYTIDPNLNTPNVFGFEVSGAYRMDDATQRVVKNSIITPGASTTVYGSDKYINQTYTFYQDIFEINPDTSVAYTGAEVNALEIGPEVVT